MRMEKPVCTACCGMDRFFYLLDEWNKRLIGACAKLFVGDQISDAGLSLGVCLRYGDGQKPIGHVHGGNFRNGDGDFAARIPSSAAKSTVCRAEPVVVTRGTIRRSCSWKKALS